MSGTASPPEISDVRHKMGLRQDPGKGRMNHHDDEEFMKSRRCLHVLEAADLVMLEA